MGGYQLMISADIFRGRYRESLETPKAITPDKALLYQFLLPTANDEIRRGIRSWFRFSRAGSRCNDRNPQTFVRTFWAKPGGYKKAVQRVFHSPEQASFIELPLVETH